MKLKIKPIAFESLGVRSMCTYIETPDISILLDPGVSLGKRFGKIPHPREYIALKSARKRLLEISRKADIIIISHYHFDHYTPLGYTDYTWTWSIPDESASIYEGKLLFVKDFRDKINFSQRKRGWIFNKMVNEIAYKVEIADGKTFKIGDTLVKISEPVWHGEADTPLGWVLMTTIKHEDETILFASDVQGPINKEALQIILSEKPNLTIIGGPPTYLQEYKTKRDSVTSAIKHLSKIALESQIVILDHHLLRDAEWRKYIKLPLENARRKGNKLVTAAEFENKQNQLLEAYRDKLYEDEPPSEEFIKWSRMPKDKRKKTPPPI